MKFKSVLCSLLLLALFGKAQTSLQLSSSEIKLSLERLNVTSSVLYIAAHPDDENTRLLSYLVSEKKVRTGYLSLTRGDGGQNLIGAEQAEQLGLIRTQELLSARRIDGAEQFFTRANDFGFSKTADETFKVWNREHILSDVVWIIRNFKPDVIITRFPGDARAGHGQHTASSLLAQEAFKVAADPDRFPEQLSLVKPWQAKRIFWNTFNFGSINTTSEDQLKINVGKYNALLGKSYGEIASESRSQHKSQGFGVAKQRGESYEYFSLLDGEPAKNDLLEGVSNDWSSLKNTSAIESLIKKLNQHYVLDAPQQSIPDLLSLHTLITQIEDEHLKKIKLKEVADLILAVSGTWFEAYATEPSFALEDTISLKIQAISRFGNQSSLSISYPGKIIRQNVSLIQNQLQTVENTVQASELTQPYWLAKKHPPSEYIIEKQQHIGYAENTSPVSVNFLFTIQGKTIAYTRPVIYKFTDPIRGEIYRNLEIVPPVTANLQSTQLVFADNSSKALSIKLKTYKNNAKGQLFLSVPNGWKTEPASIPFQLVNKGDEQVVNLTIQPLAHAISGKLKTDVKINNQAYSKSFQSIQYNHIPAITWFPDAEASLLKLDIKTGGKNIAYIPGAGDVIPDALKQLGYQVTIINANQLITANLSTFDAIITGVRLYNVEPRMKYANEKLLKYVENGGVLFVQYNVNQPLVVSNIGPYPFTISRERVTEEDAKVTILNPSHRLFNYPNKITSTDFQGWIQERGIYYVTVMDKKYESLLLMNDTNEKPNQGSLILTDYGKGRFVYTGLSFFRQLPAAVPGAYRLFVNLISK